MNKQAIILVHTILFVLGFTLPCIGTSMKEYSNAEVHLSAENLTYNQETETIHASGNVEIYYKNLIVLGDSAEVNNKTGIATIEGRVVIDELGNHISCRKAVMNMRENTGTIYDAEGILSSIFFFKGKILNSLGDNKYIVHDATITTCCDDEPSWKMGAKRAYLDIGKYAYFTLPSFSVHDIPVFYFPYVVFPIKTKRQSGLLPISFGSGGKEGWTFENTFFWAINNSQDATFTWEHQDLRGDIYGLEYRYYLTEDGKGTLEGKYHKDYDPVDQTESTLWKLKYDHNHLLPYNVQGIVHVDQASETNPDKEFEIQNLQERTKRENDSHARLTKNWASRSLQAIVRRRERSENNFNEQEKKDYLVQTNSLYTEKYDEGPDLTFVNQSQQLFSTPLYFSFDLSMKLFNKETYTETRSTITDKTDTGLDSSTYTDKKSTIGTFRADSYQKLSLPLPLTPWIAITPSAGYRYTYYSRGEKKPLTLIDSKNTSYQFPRYTKKFIRTFYDLGVSVSGPKFYKIFEAKNFAVKHLISPEISFLHKSKIQQEVKEKILLFDEVDNLGLIDDPSNIISYGIVNTFLKKTKASGVQEIARMRVSQTFNMQTEKDRLKAMDEERDESMIRPFSDIQLTLETNLTKSLHANYYTKISPYEKMKLTESVDITIDFPNIWYFSWERRWARVPNAPDTPNKLEDTFRFGLNLYEKLKFEVGKYYDDNVRIAHENDYALTYTAGCWEVGFDLINRRVIPEGSSNKTNFENRYFVTITLKDIFTYGKKGPLGFISRKF